MVFMYKFSNVSNVSKLSIMSSSVYLSLETLYVNLLTMSIYLYGYSLQRTR